MLQNDNDTGTLDAKKAGILDLMIAKSWAIKLATEAAITVLSVDQIIVARQAGGPKPPGPNPVSFHALLAVRAAFANQSRTGTRIRYLALEALGNVKKYQVLMNHEHFYPNFTVAISFRICAIVTFLFKLSCQ